MRDYVFHRWVADDDGARCYFCGINGGYWKAMLEFDSMIEWDCKSVQSMNEYTNPQEGSL